MDDTKRDKQFGQIIRQMRLQRKWTQEQLAIKVGFDPDYISRIECGRKTPRLDTVLRFASAFGIRVSFGDKKL